MYVLEVENVFKFKDSLLLDTASLNIFLTILTTYREVFYGTYLVQNFFMKEYSWWADL